jgi:hypothetical protein|tara:strand:- start:7343 stop:7921 length:579 start_codon:yes stop_codon:yes gene_type:complete
MRIGITLNEVIRDFIGQLKYVYTKYYGENMEDVDVEDFDLIKYFKFDSEKKLNEFLYSEAPMEIFAHADQLHNNIIPKLNRFISDVNDYEEHEVIILSRDAHKSRPSTLFFLSKLGFTGNSIKFLDDTSKMWDCVDVLVTANPIALENKPEGKISVKINASYNKKVEADFELDTILDFIEDESKFNEILKHD